MLKTFSMLENRLEPPQTMPAREMRVSGPVMCTRLFCKVFRLMAPVMLLGSALLIFVTTS